MIPTKEQLLNALRRWWCGVWRGVKGHPGNVPLVCLTLLGVAAGGLKGAGIMFAASGAVYCVGLWERCRSVRHDR